MSAPSTESLRSRIETTVALARLLERVEASPVGVGADQYRSLVASLRESLSGDLPARALEAILTACPATGELYENLHYEQSGLSRSPLERSVETEMLASRLIHKVSRRPATS